MFRFGEPVYLYLLIILPILVGYISIPIIADVKRLPNMVIRSCWRILCLMYRNTVRM